ncbi:MAG: ribonuclease P protein component [Candidatus Beckwithbacteria bacterium]
MRGSQIPEILKLGKTFSSPLFNLKFLSQPKGIEVGFIVSLKTAPLAVDRNRLKRRLRHAFAPFVSQLPPGRYLILAKPALNSASYQQLLHEISDLKIN